MRTAWITLGLFGFVAVASAQPLSDGPSSDDPWFHGLQQPNGGSCCSLADSKHEGDCHRMPESDIRASGDHYEYRHSLAVFGVQGDDKWYAIPDSAWLRHKENPTGFVVLCILESMHAPSGGPLVMCAIKAAGS
jgi:hypothetical protein